MGLTPKDRRAAEAYLEHGWDAMEDDDPEAAEDEARRALDLLPDAPEAHYLLGAALVDQEVYGEALEHLTRALASYPGDPSIRLDIAASQIGLLRLEEGVRGLSAVVRDDPENPDARYWLAIAHELRGEDDAAAACYAKAAELDADCFFVPPRVSEADFEKLLDTATHDLPADIRRPLRSGEVGITVMDLPPFEFLRSETPPLSPLLPGALVDVAAPAPTEGEPAAEPSPEPSPEQRPQLLLFRRNIERVCSTPEEFVDELTVTLIHEIGHYLGLEEDDIADLLESAR